MRFESTCENCILAELSNEDLELLKLTYDELDYSNERVRDTLKYILDEASAETGIMLSSENEIRIDVMPDLIGGCLIIFSKEKENITTESETVVYESFGFNNILDCARTLKAAQCKISESALYQKEDKFRLIINGCSEKAEIILNEYLDQSECNEIEEQRTKEYWKCLIASDALKVLCGQ